MTAIPKDFQIRMTSMLGEQAEPFFKTYQQPHHLGLRVNTLKLSVEEFLHIIDMDLQPVPWCPTGFYYNERDRPGKHPYHASGLYYIQEPSAMSIVEYLQPQPGEKVLDLCAAPGGKTSQIAAHMKGEGLLFSNEITPTRAKILSENVERMGIKHAIVTNESPERLADRFPLYFDRILVDAPCSGEGMFRKLEEACEDWTLGKVEECALIQRDILNSAAQMLKNGGTLVYSTCTFSKEENEQSIAGFLERHPEFELVELGHEHGISQGIPEWGGNRPDLANTARLWPHLIKGEGHFAAKLRKKGETVDPTPSRLPRAANKKVDKASMKWFDAFRQKSLIVDSFPDKYILFGDQLYLLPESAPDLQKLKIVRPGWHLGTIKKGRFEPSHSLALGLCPNNVQNSITFSKDDPNVIRYLKGESLSLEGKQKGWTLVCVDGFSLGWGKVSDGQLKNHYPKGLRWV